MKLPEWAANQQQVRWDMWKAFHVGVTRHGVHPTAVNDSYGMRGVNFFMFDTGEVVCSPTSTRPFARGYYSELDVDLVLTRDEACPQLWTPDGEKIPKAWTLYGGSRVLVIDRDTNRAVNVGWGTGDAPVTMPERFRTRKDWPRVQAYFPGPGLPPIGRAQIKVAPPLKLLPPEQREKYDEIICPARAMLTMNDQHPGRTGLDRDGNRKQYDYTRYQKLSWARVMECSTWQDLNDDELYALWHQGVERWQIGHDYLLTEKP